MKGSMERKTLKEKIRQQTNELAEEHITEENYPGEDLEHIRDSPVRVLKRLARMLRPGGHLILTTPNYCRITNIGMLKRILPEASGW